MGKALIIAILLFSTLYSKGKAVSSRTVDTFQGIGIGTAVLSGVSGLMFIYANSQRKNAEAYYEGLPSFESESKATYIFNQAWEDVEISTGATKIFFNTAVYSLAASTLSFTFYLIFKKKNKNISLIPRIQKGQYSLSVLKQF